MQDLQLGQSYVAERHPKPHLAPPASWRALVSAEVSLVLVSAAAIFSFGRVFDSWAYLRPVAATALVAHAFGAILRRRRWRSFAALPSSVIVVAIAGAAGSLRSSIRSDLSEAWSIVNNTRAPVPPTRALVLAASLLVGLAVVAADSLAFRRRALFAALMPQVLVFGLAAMYGDDRYRVASIGLLVASAVCFALAHRLAFFDRGSGWMIDRSLSLRRFVMSGLAVASCAVLVALAVGPSLPGARNEALVAWRDIGNGWAERDDGVTLSPLVSVRAQLVDQSDSEVFVVQAARPDYWRLTSLDSFDGTEWTAGNSSAASVGLPTEATTSALRQVVTIKALRGNWLPAALGPVALSIEDNIEDNTVVFDPDSATLVTEDRLGNNDSYVVWSNAAEADLTAPTSDDLSVPRTVRQRLSALANRIVRDAGAVTATDKARALEEYFLANFTYDLNVAAGSSITDITSFLQRGSGYCEQFAATFAAMARVLGIPSRVAIGYRVGTYDVTESEYRVTGRDAHAWPEVSIDGSGWVRFEPTPASADGAVGASDAATDAAAADAATPAATPEEAPATTLPAETAPQDAATPAAVDATTATRDSGQSLAPLFVVLPIAALALPVVLDRVRRRRSRHRARGDRRALMVWEWRDALRWLRIAGVDARPTETPLEVATRAAPVVSNASSEIAALAQLVTEACYAAADPAAADVEAAQAEVETIRRCAKAHVGRRWRLRAYVNQVKGVVVHAGSTSSSAAQPSSIS
ncbi:MAG TPA: DUF3488 and transglutaminase-like domain-containing protein [Acidimicrobiales bacterium]|nr:DUF3488 and transglutaminase-like domain-containing protein [Acidimicrobiales bacterium]